MTNPLDDGDYTVSLKGGYITNHDREKYMFASDKTFLVRIPEITRLSVSPSTLEHQGGAVTVTLTGKNLQYATSVQVHSTLSGSLHAATAALNGSSATYKVTIPENTDQANTKSYTFTAWLNGADVAFNDTVTVKKALSYVKFDLNGGTSAKIPDIAMEVGATVNITKYQHSGSAVPSREGYAFYGWTESGSNFLSNTFAMPQGTTTLKAEWIDLSKAIATAGSYGPNYFVVYKNESDKQTIESGITATAGYTDMTGTFHDLAVEYDWNPKNLGAGGVHDIRLYVTDPVANIRVYQDETIPIYVLNRPYIGAKYGYREFRERQSISADGSMFYPYAYLEMPNFATKSIDSIPISTLYDANGLNTETVDATYYPFFTAQVVDYFGSTIDLRTNVKAYIYANVQNEAAVTEANQQEYWIVVASVLRQAKPGEVWSVTTINYKHGGELLKETVEDGAAYDRKVIASPGEFLNMSSLSLQELQKQTNALLEVQMGTVSWSFYSTDYHNVNVTPTGIFPLKFITYDKDATVTQLIGGGNEMQFNFEMSKSWIGSGILHIKLSNALNASVEAGNKLYLFGYNADTKELELIGKVSVSGGVGSIMMKGVYGRYVLTDHLPGSVAKGTAANIGNKSTSASASGGNSTVPAYRITERTNELDKETYAEVEANLKQSGSSVEQITLSTPTKTIVSNDGKLLGAANTPFLPIAISIAGLLLLAAIGFIIWKKKSSNDESA